MITERLNDIEQRICAACERARRPRSDVTLIAVTKTLASDRINDAIAAGVTNIGENRVQEYLSKRRALLPHAFHLIGHLQRNKVKSVLPFCTMIHSVDSVRLAEEIQLQAESLARRVDILLEVNISNEDSKFGLLPDDVYTVAREVRALPNIMIRGLMTVAAFVDAPEIVRPDFRALKQLLADLQGRLPDAGMHHLSMGMTNDFEVAIEEGATLVRLGTALFGERMN